MNEQTLEAVLGVLREKRSDFSALADDWYTTLGFLELNRVAVPFLNAAGRLGLSLPQQVARRLQTLRYTQTARQRLMFRWAQKLGAALDAEGIRHAFLKGSILSSASFPSAAGSRPVYAAGERTSNDIDLLLPAGELTRADRVLRSFGFAQGYWDFTADAVMPLSRREIVWRRMNRGETAPYLRRTGDPALPFIEIDLNFSLDCMPTGTAGAVEKMLNAGRYYDNGLFSLSPDDFLIHLLLHQYKEATVYSMVLRNKDVELYKYLDIYRMLQNVDPAAIADKAGEYGAGPPCEAVLGWTAELFGLRLPFRAAETTVADPESGRKFAFTAGLKERLCRYDSAAALVEVTA